MKKLCTTLCERHRPSTIPEVHCLLTGQHCTHCSVPPKAKTKFTDTITNHTNIRAPLPETRSSEMANEVLLQLAARMEAKPALMEKKFMAFIEDGGMSK